MGIDTLAIAIAAVMIVAIVPSVEYRYISFAPFSVSLYTIVQKGGCQV